MICFKALTTRGVILPQYFTDDHIHLSSMGLAVVAQTLSSSLMSLKGTWNPEPLLYEASHWWLQDKGWRGIGIYILEQSRWIHSTISFSKSLEYFKIYPKDNTSGYWLHDILISEFTRTVSSDALLCVSWHKIDASKFLATIRIKIYDWFYCMASTQLAYPGLS